MDNWLMSKLKEQGTHTGIVLLVLLVLVAKAAGVTGDVINAEMANLITGIGALSALAKIVIKG